MDSGWKWRHPSGYMPGTPFSSCAIRERYVPGKVSYRWTRTFIGSRIPRALSTAESRTPPKVGMAAAIWGVSVTSKIRQYLRYQ